MKRVWDKIKVYSWEIRLEKLNTRDFNRPVTQKINTISE